MDEVKDFDNFITEFKTTIKLNLTIMKTLKTLLTVFAVAAVFSAGAYAQSADVSIAADVQAAITVTKNADVDFGVISATSSPVLDPQGTNTADVGGGSAFGKLTVSGPNETQLLIDWDQTTVTLGDGNSNTILFTPDISANSTDAIASSSDVTKNTANTVSETSATGALYIYIGGNLGSLNGATTGVYSSDTGDGGSGPLNVSVSYQ
ncbi:DUF4402 domain-containing protein [Gracilimonas tropica]|uniref:DUF4402 domain-containing protein n=1 Tax=Gracilimonas tropica TaxID=454600 RepID=UPI00037F3FD8|nr:DUF4402 domain-containing protein [Gracilimonas tropica]